MLKINSTTQRASRIIRSYNNSKATQLWHVYGSYSDAKARAYERCIWTMRELSGRNLRILGASPNFFSVGFLFTNEDGIECLAYITHCDTYYIPLGSNTSKGGN